MRWRTKFAMTMFSMQKEIPLEAGLFLLERCPVEPGMTFLFLHRKCRQLTSSVR